MGKVPLTAKVAVDVKAGLEVTRAVGVGLALKSGVPTERVWVAIASGVPDDARAVLVPKLATSLMVMPGV